MQTCYLGMGKPQGVGDRTVGYGVSEFLQAVYSNYSAICNGLAAICNGNFDWGSDPKSPFPVGYQAPVQWRR